MKCYEWFAVGTLCFLVCGLFFEAEVDAKIVIIMTGPINQSPKKTDASKGNHKSNNTSSKADKQMDQKWARRFMNRFRKSKSVVSAPFAWM